MTHRKPFYDMDYKDKQRLCSKRTRDLKKAFTESENHVAKLLSELGVKHKKQKGFIKGDFFCIADFYLPAPYCAVIEVDGGYHTTPKQQYRDVMKDEYYRWRRFRILRITDEQAMSMDSIALKDELDRLMGQPRKTRREQDGKPFK